MFCGWNGGGGCLLERSRRRRLGWRRRRRRKVMVSVDKIHISKMHLVVGESGVFVCYAYEGKVKH